MASTQEISIKRLREILGWSVREGSGQWKDYQLLYAAGHAAGVAETEEKYRALVDNYRVLMNTCPECDHEGRYTDGSGACYYCTPAREALRQLEVKP